MDCVKISDWMKANKLKLNPTKTHIMTMGTQKRLSSILRPIEVTMDNVVLAESKHDLLLGCKISANLKWNHQVSMLIAKLTTRLKGLALLQYICPYHIRKTLAEGIFKSVLIYCLPVYGGLEVGQVKEIQVIYNKAARLVCRLPPRTSRKELFNKLGWMTLRQLVVYHTLVAVFRIRQAKALEYLHRFLNNDSRNKRILFPQQKLTLTYDSFCFRGSRHWNQLPSDLRYELNSQSFNAKLKAWVFGNVPMFYD